jgi:tetratricopeptide (TPR) repeat protein
MQNPKHAKAAAVLAGLYFDLKKPEMGLMYAKKAAKLDPKDQQVQFWLGKHAFDTKDIDSAIKHLTKAVEGIPPPIPADVMERWKNNKSLDGLGDIPMPPLYAGEACMILGLCLEEKRTSQY